MRSRLSNYLEKFEILYHRQLGFREKLATVDALAEVTEGISLGVDTNMKCSFFSWLKKKAFDTLGHSILLRKLECYWVRGSCYRWFKSYLSNRSQCINVSNCFSYWLPITISVPQGSVLGPLLFLVFINDMHHAVANSNVFLFAGDTNISCDTSNFEDFQLELTNISKLTLPKWVNLKLRWNYLNKFKKKRSASNLCVNILDNYH